MGPGPSRPHPHPRHSLLGIRAPDLCGGARPAFKASCRSPHPWRGAWGGRNAGCQPHLQTGGNTLKRARQLHPGRGGSRGRTLPRGPSLKHVLVCPKCGGWGLALPAASEARTSCRLSAFLGLPGDLCVVGRVGESTVVEDGPSPPPSVQLSGGQSPSPAASPSLHPHPSLHLPDDALSWSPHPLLSPGL